MKSFTKTFKNTIYGTSVLFVIILLWIILSTTKQNELIFPSLSKILSQVGQIFTEQNLNILLLSILRLLFSVLFALGVSFFIAFLYIWKKESIVFFNPIIRIMRSVPFIALSIFIILAFGNRLAPYVICELVIIPIAVQGIINGIDNIDSSLIDDLKLYNNNFWKALLYVYIPITLPTIITTTLQIFGLGFKVIIMGEYLSQTPNSIGKALYYAQSFHKMDDVLAWTIIIVFITTIIEVILNKYKQIIHK